MDDLSGLVIGNALEVVVVLSVDHAQVMHEFLLGMREAWERAFLNEWLLLSLSLAS
jgi:hypothetical protein